MLSADMLCRQTFEPYDSAHLDRKKANIEHVLKSVSHSLHLIVQGQAVEIRWVIGPGYPTMFMVQTARVRQSAMEGL